MSGLSALQAPRVKWATPERREVEDRPDLLDLPVRMVRRVRLVGWDSLERVAARDRRAWLDRRARREDKARWDRWDRAARQVRQD